MDRTHEAAKALDKRWQSMRGRYVPEHGKPGHIIHQRKVQAFTKVADKVATEYNVHTEPMLKEYAVCGFAA